MRHILLKESVTDVLATVQIFCASPQFSDFPDRIKSIILDRLLELFKNHPLPPAPLSVPAKADDDTNSNIKGETGTSSAHSNESSRNDEATAEAGAAVTEATERVENLGLSPGSTADLPVGRTKKLTELLVKAQSPAKGEDQPPVDERTTVARQGRPSSSTASHPSVPVPAPRGNSPVSQSDDQSYGSTQPATYRLKYLFKIPVGSTGYGYNRVFADCLDERLKSVRVEDPYIRYPYQIQNFFRFCELLDRECKNLERITLITHKEGDKYEPQIKQKLDPLLTERGIELRIKYDPDLHDRKIDFDNGWKVMLGRGLDYFEPSEDWPPGGDRSMNLRPCKKTTIVVLRRTAGTTESAPFESKFSGEYTIQAVIGHGKFGVVFKAQHKLDEQLYAIKRIHVTDAERAIEKVVQEVRSMAPLNHPNIVRYSDAWLEKPPPGWKPEDDDSLPQGLQSIRQQQNGKGNDVQPDSEGVTQTDTESLVREQPAGARKLLKHEELIATTNSSVTRVESWANDRNPSIPVSGTLPRRLMKGSDDTSSSSSSPSSFANGTAIPSKNDNNQPENIEFDHDGHDLPSHDDTSKGDALPMLGIKPVYLYIRMELCSGSTLREWLGQNRLPEQRPISQTLDWFRQLVSAIKHIHDEGLIHRDIKPENIFFGSLRDGTTSVLKIGDFGLAIDVAVPPSSGVSGGVRASLSNAGTPMYMSPEQLSGHRCTTHADIFSLGLVFLEMLHSFKTDRRRRGAFGALQSGKRPDVMDELDKKMGTLISRMTAPEPEKRATASELDNELRKMSPFTDLPRKLMLKIFGYLYEDDLTRCTVVSREFRAIANHQILWKSLYQEVFEYSHPLLHVGHAQFEFREPHDWPQPRFDESIVVNPWKESFKQLRSTQALQKDGIHVRPGCASLYSGFGAGGRRLTQCDQLDQALRLVKARGKNAEKLIFLHTGLYIPETTVMINSNIQIIGASAGPDIASRVIIEGRHDTTVVLEEGSQGAYLGWMTVRSVPGYEAMGTVIAARNPRVRPYHYALQICGDSTALVEHCVIHSSATVGAAVYVNGSAANPTMRHCVVCDCEGGGIYVTDKARGQFEDCEIARNNWNGVWVGSHANPFFRRCHIHDGRSVGIYMFDHGMGCFESCDIHNNHWVEIDVLTAANPTVTRCEVHHGQAFGIRVHSKGQGQFMENRIHSNELAGIEIKSHSNPKITRNKIRSNQKGGVLIHKSGQGVLEDNEIFDNAMAGVRIQTDGNPMLRRNKIYNGRSKGIHISNKGRGILEENDIYRNAKAGVLIESESNPTLRRNRVYEGRTAGIVITNGAMATLESNAIFHNRFGGPFLATGVQPTLHDNKIYDNDSTLQ